MDKDLAFYAHIDIIIQLHPSRAIKLHLFQCLPDHIIGLPFRGLCRLDHCCFINVALVVNIELAKGVLEAENVGFLKLRVFPVEGSQSVRSEKTNDRMRKSAKHPTPVNNAPLQLYHVHGWLRRKVATRSGVEGCLRGNWKREGISRSMWQRLWGN